MNNAEIGERMRQLRENAGLSAKDVSQILLDKYGIEMNHRTLFNYEKGRSSPDLVRFLALCEIYHCRNLLAEFNSSIHISSSDGYEDITLFEDEFDPDQWQAIKSFLALIPKKTEK